MSVESGMVSGDRMLSQGLTDFERLWALKTAMNHWPGTRTLEVTLRLLDGRSESPGESRGRYLFRWLGLPKPELQYEVVDAAGRLVAINDFAWPDRNIYGEFDGKVNTADCCEPGQDPGEVVFAEKRREDEIRRVTRRNRGAVGVERAAQCIGAHTTVAPARQTVGFGRLRPPITHWARRIARAQ